jgi:uncharacterized protein involved in response to NO
VKSNPPSVSAPAVPARIFVPFFIASLVLTLTWGATLGMINLARLTAGWGLGALPRPSVWAHAYVQVFGFMALFIMGVAYHVIPRFVGGALERRHFVRWSLWQQTGGVVAIACAFFHDGPLTRPLWIAGSVSLLTASAMFCAVMLRTVRSAAPTREPFRRWILAGACWLPVISVLALVAAIANDVTWHRVLWTAALFGFITSWIFGVGRRILPIFLGCQPRWTRLEPAIFIAYQVGTAAWAVAAWPNVDSHVLMLMRGLGAVLLMASVPAYTACVGLFAHVGPVHGCAIRNPQDGWQKYVLAAWSWLFVSVALGPGAAAVRLVTGGTESVLVYDVARHAMAFGFAAQMILGVASRVVPNFTGKPLFSPVARDAAFYLLNASMAVRALEAPIASGIWTRGWNYIAWSGPLGVAAMLLFTVNIFMTIRQQPSTMLQPTAPPRALQLLIARK